MGQHHCGDISIVSFCHIGVTRTVLYLHSMLIIKYTPQQRVFGAFFWQFPKLLDWIGYIFPIFTQMRKCIMCYYVILAISVLLSMHCNHDSCAANYLKIDGKVRFCLMCSSKELI